MEVETLLHPVLGEKEKDLPQRKRAQPGGLGPLDKEELKVSLGGQEGDQTLGPQDPPPKTDPAKLSPALTSKSSGQLLLLLLLFRFSQLCLPSSSSDRRFHRSVGFSSSETGSRGTASGFWWPWGSALTSGIPACSWPSRSLAAEPASSSMASASRSSSWGAGKELERRRKQ